LEEEGKTVRRLNQGEALHRPANRDTQSQMKITIEVDGEDAEELFALLDRAVEAVERLETILEEFEDEPLH
tara:strand:+ start:48 stop:260 length:213 start_codon:yes stop_codon:yes gene_type:complete